MQVLARFIYNQDDVAAKRADRCCRSIVKSL